MVDSLNIYGLEQILRILKRLAQDTILIETGTKVRESPGAPK